MSILAPSTELEAVNEMLAVIGESPVTTLESDEFVDATVARNLLHRVSRTVQTKGWSFNTISHFPLSPDSNGDIFVPNNTLKIDQHPQFDSRFDTVMRGQRMFDKKSLSFKFTEGLTFEIVQFLAFDEIPEAFRTFITIRAARIFQVRMIGSETMTKLTEEEEHQAWIEALNSDGEVADYTMLDGSWDVARVLER